MPGSLIGGRYMVEHALGKGGMGSVYAVFDQSSERRLALKYLRREAALENGPAAALFQREYHTLAHLRHPGVIQVHDYGVDDGRPYYTMELLDGSDLRELAPLPWSRACRVLRDIASSLALLHSRRLLHRDLSPRNVRCTRDGHAMLFDFGTMAPMGVAKDVAGTPPYMAPEAVHGQALDARTDLYALGALAYWTLTGYDAYPARDARELRQLWPRAVLPPSAIAPGVPEALDALVMSLLSLDPQARPSHVAEVIERLTAIASLPPADQMEVARAYLTSPTLIGHGERLASFHKRLVRATRGRGSSVLIRGRAGSGRSRLLQALTLEAKLGGILVLAADAEDAQRGELGVARALVDALVIGAPDLALSTFRAHCSELGALFPQLQAELDDAPPLAHREDHRAQLARVLQAIRDWLVAVSQQRPLMIAVDDADHADEWSAACLALLAGDARDEALVVATTVENQNAHKALEVLSSVAACLDLAPLDAEQTVGLLRSVFGDVSHLQVVADWIHGLAQGNPRTVMELSQYLVDHGIARYERGSFILPETLRDQALPKSIEQALDELLCALSPPARELAEALSLVTEHGHLELDELDGLAEFQRSEQTYGALDELVAAQVVVAIGTTHSLRQRGLALALQKGLTDQRRALLHLRLAHLYEARLAHAAPSTAVRLLAAYHRYRGGDMQRCFDALSSMPPTGDIVFGHSPEAAAMYDAGLAYAEVKHVSPARVYPLRKTLLRLSSTADPSLIKHAEATLAQLCRDSGRSYFEAQSADGEPLKRIRSCIKRARESYEQTDESQRGLDPIHAIYELGACVVTLTETYVASNDEAALARLPALLGPFRPLSPVLELLHELSLHALDALLGKDVMARRLKMLTRLALPLDGLDPSNQQGILAVLTYWVGMDEAVVGKNAALDRAAALERQPLYAPLGAQVRSIYHLFSGNEEEAEVWQKRRELLALRSPFSDVTSARGIMYEAIGYYLCGSVLGMRNVLLAIAKLAERHPGWKRDLRTVEGLYALLRGEPAAALALLDLELGAAARVQALLALGAVSEARACADEALIRQRAHIDHPLFLLRLQTARALAWGADAAPAAAAQALDADIEHAERAGVGGMLLGIMHEARARIAIEMDDRAAFRRHIRELGTSYGRATSGLRARYEQLGVAARRAMLSMPPSQVGPQASPEETASSDVRSLLDAAFTREERLSEALGVLARRAKSQRGFLFGMQRSGLRLAATLGSGPPPDGLEDMLSVYLSAELETSEAVANTVTGTFAAAPDMVAWINDGQHLYYPVLLSCDNAGVRQIGGVAVLALPVQRDPKLPSELIAEISRALLESGDVIGADAAD
jgi:hypothetical protein